jgi:predicted MPP superfamily phosphohydrolase
MKKLISTLFFIAVTNFIFAQTTPTVQSTIGKLGKNKALPCLAITVDGDASMAISTLKDLLKKEEVKVKSSSKKLEGNAVIFNKISNNLLNIYATATDIKGTRQTTMNVFIAGGIEANTFKTKTTDPAEIEALTLFLENDFVKAQKIAFDEQIKKEKEKALKKALKEKKKTEKEIDKLNQKIEELNKVIEINQPQ